VPRGAAIHAGVRYRGGVLGLGGAWKKSLTTMQLTGGVCAASRRAAVAVPRVDPDAPSSVVRTLTLQTAALKRRHRDEVAQLRQDLAAAHGEILALRRRLGEQRR
jgi:hypothetical protein